MLLLRVLAGLSLERDCNYRSTRSWYLFLPSFLWELVSLSLSSLLLFVLFNVLVVSTQCPAAGWQSRNYCNVSCWAELLKLPSRLPLNQWRSPVLLFRNTDPLQAFHLWPHWRSWISCFSPPRHVITETHLVLWLLHHQHLFILKTSPITRIHFPWIFLVMLITPLPAPRLTFSWNRS